LIGFELNDGGRQEAGYFARNDAKDCAARALVIVTLPAGVNRATHYKASCWALSAKSKSV